MSKAEGGNRKRLAEIHRREAILMETMRELQETRKESGPDRWGKLSSLCNSAAFMMHGLGRIQRAQAMRREAVHYELARMGSIGIREARISTCKDQAVCPACRSLEGRVLPVEHALRTMPLPVRHADGSLCRCNYIAEIKIKASPSHSRMPKGSGHRQLSPTGPKAGCAASLAIFFAIFVLSSFALAWVATALK